MYRSLQVRADTTIQELLDSAAALAAMPASQMELFVRTEEFSHKLENRMRAVRHAVKALRRADHRNMPRFAEVLRDAADDLVQAAKGRGRGF
jgi:two-component sensor histidine kinase